MASAFMHYQLALAEKKMAYEQYNYAGAALELATIRCRLAEIVSQHEPLGHIDSGLAFTGRQKMIAAAQYVVLGRYDECQQPSS